MKRIYIIFFISTLFSCDDKINYHQNLELVWRTENVNWNASSLILNNGEIYGHTISDSIFKINFKTGKLIWKRYSRGSYESLTPKIYNNIIYIGGADKLKAFNKNGKLIWSVNTNTKTAGLLINDTTILNTRTDEGLFANNLKSGKEFWHIKPSYQMLSMSIPTAKDSLLILGNFDYKENIGSHLTCINLNNQKIKWQIANGNYLNSPPIVDENYVFFSCDSSYKKGYTYKADLLTGKVLWKTATNPVIFYKSLIDENQVYIASYENGVVCLNKKAGQKLWKLKKELYPDTEFIFHKGVLYFGTVNRKFIGVNKEGKIVFETNFEYGIGNPFVYNDNIYVNDGNGNMFKIKHTAANSGLAK